MPVLFKPGKALDRFGGWLAVVLITLYQLFIKPHLTGQCRFTPSCSHYALQAFKTQGVVHGTILTVKRLAQCHPWGKKT